MEKCKCGAELFRGAYDFLEELSLEQTENTVELLGWFRCHQCGRTFTAIETYNYGETSSVVIDEE